MLKNLHATELPRPSGRTQGRFDVTEQADGVGQKTDEQLLAEFLAGSAGAFEGLVERHGADLHQFVSRFVRNSATAEDVVQETFVQVHQAAVAFDSARSFRPWLFTIAANKARDHLRSRARKREVSLSAPVGSADHENPASYLHFFSDDATAPDERLSTAEQATLVRRVVSDMPDALREVLVLGYYQRFPYKDIAKVLGIPLGTVKSRLHTAVSYFAEAYKREFGDER